jgi:ankyrin repeat protein
MSGTDKRWYEFRDAVRRRQYDVAQRLLAGDRQILNLRSGIGETVLHFLAVENHATGVGWLHGKGADLNTKNKFGTPVVFEVAKLDYKDLFVWFVENGVDLKAVDQDGQGLVAHLGEFGHSKMIAFVQQLGA